MDTGIQSAESIKAWCEKKDISRSMFYLLRKKGLAPKIMKVGSRCLITPKADAAWHELMESRTVGGGNG